MSTERDIQCQSQEQESPESILQHTQAVKEVSSEREANAYLKAGWTLIKTYSRVDHRGDPTVGYVLAWTKTYAKPKEPHIIRNRG